ncbi:MAG: hypothetical protein HOV80_35870 [Polyangiaceae bacterium]|nr:hypothetical protein [Polyangiaceae bacterium]
MRNDLLVASAALLVLGVPVTAQAAPCADLPNPVYLQVGDTQEPLMKRLGQKLRENTPNPITIIYKTSGSCTNIDAIYNGTLLTTNPSYVPSMAEMPTWDPSQPSPTCDIDPAGVDLDVTNSNVFIDACTATPMPMGIAAFTGPVQPYLFVVPEASTQTAITAEEAYFVFGFGAAGQVEPWNDEAFMFIRTTTKSTLISMAANIGVPPNKMKGMPFDSSSQVLNAVSTSVSPEKTIGLLGAEIYDQNRATVNALAFRTYGQSTAYYADSTKDSFDKRNVRDGHYSIWSPTVYLTHVDNQGNPVNANAGYVIDLILGNDVMPEPNFDALDVVVSGVKLVPNCAMSVQRASEGGPLSGYCPPEPCGCYFDSKLGTPADSCVPCTNNDACNGGVCRHGFCESR